jgi:hypothetical protein
VAEFRAINEAPSTLLHGPLNVEGAITGQSIVASQNIVAGQNVTVAQSITAGLDLNVGRNTSMKRLWLNCYDGDENENQALIMNQRINIDDAGAGNMISLCPSDCVAEFKSDGYGVCSTVLYGDVEVDTGDVTVNGEVKIYDSLTFNGPDDVTFTLSTSRTDIDTITEENVTNLNLSAKGGTSECPIMKAVFSPPDDEMHRLEITPDVKLNGSLNIGQFRFVAEDGYLKLYQGDGQCAQWQVV